jgi:bla regulator protein BlaR1
MTVLKFRKRQRGRTISAALGIAALATAVISGGPPLPLRGQSSAVEAQRAAPVDERDWQRAAGGKMAFEVASVKPSKPEFKRPNFPLDLSDNYSGSTPPPEGRFRAVYPLSVYIEFAYKQMFTPKSRDSLTAHLPKWVATDYFEINARAEGTPTKDQMRLMMQSLLADRFNLKVHFETQQVPVYALTLVKPGRTGPKLRPHADGPPCVPPSAQVSQASLAKAADTFPPDCDSIVLEEGPNGTLRFGSRNSTMALIASSLADMDLDRPVVDQTGLQGRFDIACQWKPESDDAESLGANVSLGWIGGSFFEALKDQLGLKLTPTKGPVKVLVVDHVEKPSEN